jgi:uncharacterized phage infection (PIP) family protein YhgE
MRLQAEQEQLKRQAEQERKEMIVRIADKFETDVDAVAQALSASASQMQSTSQSMSATAEETSRQASAVAAASEQASSNVQTVASAAEQLAASIREIARKVSESSEAAQGAHPRCTARTGGRAGTLQRGREDRRGDRPDQQHRRADQSTGAERHHQSGARRRGRQGLRGGR